MRRQEHNVQRAVGDADKMRPERGEADAGRRAGGEASTTKDVARVGSADVDSRQRRPRPVEFETHSCFKFDRSVARIAKTCRKSVLTF